jgi:hypothetical protein
LWNIILLYILCFISTLDFDTVLAVLRVSGRFSLNRNLSIFVFIICVLTSFLSTEVLNILLVMGSECCQSQSNLFVSINFLSSSVFLSWDPSICEVTDATQEMAEARSFSIVSIALSRLANVSGRAAFILGFIAGAPRNIAFAGNR